MLYPVVIPVIYNNQEHFPLGGCKVLRKSKQDRISDIGVGITVYVALKGFDALKGVRNAIADMNFSN